MDPSDAATYLTYGQSGSACGTDYTMGGYGTVDLGVGVANYVNRALLRWDLSMIPAKARVVSAGLELSYPANSANDTGIRVHRMLQPWTEGTGASSCGGAVSGASWGEAQPGVAWRKGGVPVLGGAVDLSTTPAGLPPKNRSTAGTDQLNVLGLVQSWVNGTPNHGLMVKQAAEGTYTAPGSRMGYYSDQSGLVDKRPLLKVDWEDPTKVAVTSARLTSPTAGAMVRGRTWLAAHASAPRGVKEVRFAVGGTVVGTDESAPFAVEWDSALVGNGNHSVTATAVSTAGQISAGSAQSVRVDNSPPPTDVEVLAPTESDTVRGTLNVAAIASDDIAVARVDLMVDGVLVGSDTTGPPYQIAWNTTAPLSQAFDGTHQLTVRAIDSSGQSTTSAPVSVMVDNNIDAGAPGPYKASFTMNGYGSSTEPFELAPMIDTDNVQDLTTGGTGDIGGGTGTGGKGDLAESPSCDVQCSNPLTGTPVTPRTARAAAKASRTAAVTTTVVAAANPVSPHAFQLDLAVRNDSTVAWKNSTTGPGLQLWYRWYTEDGVVLFEGPGSDYFPATLNPGGTKTIPVTVEPPPGVNASQRTRMRLRFDIYDSVTGRWFAQGGSKPVDQPVIVNKTLSKQLGFERFWHYEQLATGAGSAAYTNVANGNLLWRWSPTATPGRGVATLLDLTYNSLEEHSDSPAGNNVSLNLSGLVRFGSRLDIHPNKADQLNGKSRRFVRFLDGDGTLHEFTGTANGDGTVTWTEPAGVNLYLRSTGSSDPRRYWALTRPDRMTYFFDADGYPRLVEDTNGNVLEFELADTPPGDDPGGPKKRVVKIWDPARRAYQVDYFDKGEVKPARIRGKVQSISDHSGSRLLFDYYNDGNLRKLTQAGGVSAQGVSVPDRSFIFTYMHSAGAEPAIPVAADRVDPDPATNNQSVKLYSIRDPRGHETTVAYWGSSPDPKNRWKLRSWTDRAAKTTTFGYNWQSRITTVDAPAGRDTDFHADTLGRITSIIDPAERTTGLAWSTDNKVTQVTHPSGRSEGFSYDHNGYLLSTTNEAGETTKLGYEYRGLDARDTAGHWAVLKTRELPEGVATPVAGDHTWTFGADSDGNITTVQDPDSHVTRYAYNLRGSTDPGAGPGTVRTQTQPRGGVTAFEYHPSGQPTKIIDPAGNVTTIGYDADSRAVTVQDGEHQSPPPGLVPRAYQQTFDFDEFGRVARHSEPKSTAAEANRLVWRTTDYDPNDNTTAASLPAYAGVDGAPAAALTRTAYDDMDRPVLTTSPDTSVDPAGERGAVSYDDAGRPVVETAPKGVRSATAGDFQTVTSYDVLDRVTRVAAYGASSNDVRYSHQCYNAADDVASVTAPRAQLATVDCAAATIPFTTRYSYDNAHRVTATTDPAGHQQRAGYDKNGRTTTIEKDIAAAAPPNPKRVQRTEVTYNGRGLPVESVETFSASTGRKLFSRYRYDADGNLTETISPRAVDADAGAGTYARYVTRHEYDLAGRRTKTTLPYDDRDGAERQHVHTAYDRNSRPAWTSLPTTTSDPAQVTAAAKTQQSYFDPGWIRTLGKTVNPTLHFDYNALGLQTTRTPEKKTAPGEMDLSQRLRWDYYIDGMRKERTDRDGNTATWTYDEHNQVTRAVDPIGVHGADDAAVELEASYTGFGEVAKARHRKTTSSTWTFSAFTYNEHGLPVTRLENGEEDTAGAQTKAPRNVTLTYDASDWLTEQLDRGTSPACKGDQRTVSTYWDTGWEKTRDHFGGSTGCWSDPASLRKWQSTAWTQFDNGKLATMTTRNTSGAVTESHDIDYFESGRYEDGHRVTDTFVLKRAADRAGATNCVPGSPCLAEFDYDARGKVLRHQKQPGKVSTYSLDQPAQLVGDTSIRAGNVTTETTNNGRPGDPITTTRKYEANQLLEATATATGGSSETLKTWYDNLGNTDCVTTTAGAPAKCNGPKNRADATVRTEYTYDPLERLLAQASYTGAATPATPTDSSEYVYDALDRLIEETEDHAGTGNDRKAVFSHLGLTALTTREQQSGGTDPRTKTFTYNAVGQRLSMADQATGSSDTTQNWYSYGTDVHSSVTQLLDENGGIKASYGYDAYGRPDTTDTDTTGLSSGDLEDLKPFNPYRYTGKRLDSGTAGTGRDATSIDMGARRYGLDTGRFLQQDMLDAALGDLGLSLDPLSQNRYALAGGNPVSNLELDGHSVKPDAGGGATTSGGTTTTSTTTQTTSETSGGTNESNQDTDSDSGDSGGNWFQRATNAVGDVALKAPGTAKDFYTGQAKQIRDTAKGLATLATENVKCNFAANCDFHTNLVKTVANNPGQLWHAIADPVRDEWNHGSKAEASGRAVAMITEAALGSKGLGRAGSAVARVGTGGRSAALSPGPGAAAAGDLAGRSGGRLARFGLEKESAGDLARQAAQAETHGFPHGVSTFSRSTRADAVWASRSAVEDYFPVIKTGKNPYHYTVQLPKPVTDDVADLFNSLFGRR